MTRQQLTSDNIPLDSIGKHNLNRLDLALTLAGFGAAARKEILGRVERDLPIVIKNDPQATGKTTLYQLLDAYVARVYEEDDEGVLYIHAADKYVSIERKDGTLAIGDYRPPVLQDDIAPVKPEPESIANFTNRSPQHFSYTLKDFTKEHPHILKRKIKSVKLCEGRDPASSTGQRLIIEFVAEEEPKNG